MNLKGCIPAANRNWVHIPELRSSSVVKKQDSLCELTRTQGHLRNSLSDEISDTMPSLPSLYELAWTGLPVMQPGFSEHSNRFPTWCISSNQTQFCSGDGERRKKDKDNAEFIISYETDQKWYKQETPQMWMEPLPDHSLVAQYFRLLFVMQNCPIKQTSKIQTE